jgi:hypothetical protein
MFVVVSMTVIVSSERFVTYTKALLGEAATAKGSSPTLIVATTALDAVSTAATVQIVAMGDGVGVGVRGVGVGTGVGPGGGGEGVGRKQFVDWTT